MLIVAAALIAVMAATAIGSYVYRAGVARGLADAGKLPPVAAVPYPYYGTFWHGPFWFGGPVFFVLFFIVLFALLRGALWRRGWGYPHGCRSGDAPRELDDWHRRAHESMGPPARPA